jgi:hypothetical protein
MHSFFLTSIFFHESLDNQMVVEGTPSGKETPSRIGAIASTPRGAVVRIMDCSSQRSKLLVGFRASSVDQALAMVKGHHTMAGLNLRTVY